MDMKKILQALDGLAAKPVEGVDSMAKFLRVVKEADLNQPTTPVAPTAPAPAAEEPIQSPEQIKYNQLRAQWDGYQAMTDSGPNTFVSKDPAHDAKLQKIPVELARMAAALKAKGIDAEADYAAIGGPKSAPVDINQKYKDDELAPVSEGISKFLSVVRKNDVSILKEGKGPLNRLTQAESIAVYHSKPVARETVTSPVLNVAAGAKPSMIGKYFKTVEQEFVEGANRTKNRARHLAERVIERVTMGPDGKVTGGYKPQLSEPAPAVEPAQAPSNVKPSGSTVEYGGSTYSVNVFGDGMRPRIGRSDKVVTAKVYTLGDKMYVLLDPAAQEGVAEGESDAIDTVAKRLTDPKDGMTAKLRAAGDKRREDKLKGRNISRRDTTSKDEWGDLKADESLKTDNPCWKGYKPVGTKKKGGKTVPNCVPK